MKKLIVVLAFAGFSNLVSAEGMDMKLKGMTCDSCEAKVEGKFKNKPEVLTAKADYEKGTLHLEFKAGKNMSKADAEILVREAGYIPQ